MDVKGKLEVVEAHLEQRFKRSQKHEEESTRKEACNYQLGKNTATTMDKLERLRSKIGASLSKKENEKTGAAKDILDKWLLRDFLEKSKEKGRLNELEYKEIWKQMNKDEYDWTKCKKTIKEEMIDKEKEQKEENDTKYGEYEEEKCSDEESNETNWVNNRGNSRPFNRNNSRNRDQDYKGRNSAGFKGNRNNSGYRQGRSKDRYRGKPGQYKTKYYNREDKKYYNDKGFTNRSKSRERSTSRNRVRHFTPNGGRYRKVSKGDRVYDQSRSRSRDYKQEVLKAACGTLVKALNINKSSID